MIFCGKMKMRTRVEFWAGINYECHLYPYIFIFSGQLIEILQAYGIDTVFPIDFRQNLRLTPIIADGRIKFGNSMLNCEMALDFLIKRQLITVLLLLYLLEIDTGVWCNEQIAVKLSRRNIPTALARYLAFSMPKAINSSINQIWMQDHVSYFNSCKIFAYFFLYNYYYYY